MEEIKEKEVQKVLDELKGVRPEKLTGEAKRLFEAIMKIADERDELEYKYNRAIEDLIKLEKERQADKEKIEELEKQNEELLEVKISANAHNRICKLEQELMEKELMIDGLKEDRRIAAEEIQEQYYISKDKVKIALQDIEDYFDRLNVPDEDIEFIQSIKNELLKDGGE